MSMVSVNIPEGLHEAARRLAGEIGVTVEQLLSSALGEKVSAMAVGREWFDAMAARGSRAAFEAALAKIPDVEPEDERDRLPPKGG